MKITGDQLRAMLAHGNGHDVVAERQPFDTYLLVRKYEHEEQVAIYPDGRIEHELVT